MVCEMFNVMFSVRLEGWYGWSACWLFEGKGGWLVNMAEKG